MLIEAGINDVHYLILLFYKFRQGVVLYVVLFN